MNPTTSAMLERMLGNVDTTRRIRYGPEFDQYDPEWAPTLMRRSDIDTTVDEPDPEPIPARPAIEVKRPESVAFEINELVTCPVCKLKTFDDQIDRCRYPDCSPR